ncbi:MAG: RecQ family ATP-dependent DNA helicase, partial [Patescibacteria group bacterium]|nr:RecQ family ATP-dependent DNA helicase [Patescibacteria group bacterium]
MSKNYQPDSKTPLNSYLKQYFGYDQFRQNQSKIIQTILNKNDLLAVLPTGGGKSICYQLPGLIKPGLTLVISPLISLMADQVSALQKKEISATFINSSISLKEKRLRFKQLKQETYKFLYLAPERLSSKKIINILSQIKINQIAIDEAHCISLWGHDFRPSYLHIKKFIKTLKKRPIISAFTATATNLVKQDIIKSLDLNQPKIFANQSLRTNLQLNIEAANSLGEKEVKLAKILSLNSGKTGIIYCSTVKNTCYLANWINKLNFNQQLCQTKVHNYHGRLAADEKNLIQEKFMKGKIDLICATNAFGMGIDKDNIRFVIHYDMPGSLEN